MKIILIVCFIFITFFAGAQNYEQCMQKDLPRTNTAVSLRSSIVGDTIFISPEQLKEGIKLELPSSIGRIIGYYVVKGCEGCDLIGVPVCGSKMEDKFFQRIKNFRNGDWLQFYRINIKMSSKVYLAPEFIVYIKE